MLFELLNFSKTLLFYSFNILKRAYETSITSSYIYFMKTTNEWIIDDIIRPFEDWEMLILNIKQEIFKSLLLMPLHGQKKSLQELWRHFKFSTCIF